MRRKIKYWLMLLDSKLSKWFLQFYVNQANRVGKYRIEKRYQQQFLSSDHTRRRGHRRPRR